MRRFGLPGLFVCASRSTIVFRLALPYVSWFLICFSAYGWFQFVNTVVTLRARVIDPNSRHEGDSHAFRTLDRRTLGIVTQTRTGHGHFGEHYQTRNIQEPTNCPCGAELQTREHIVFECQVHEEYGYTIDEGAPDHQLASLFGTKTGIDALAEFVRKSKALQKTRTTETLQKAPDPPLPRPTHITQRKHRPHRE
jgi:hypothetical protein